MYWFWKISVLQLSLARKWRLLVPAVRVKQLCLSCCCDSIRCRLVRLLSMAWMPVKLGWPSCAASLGRCRSSQCCSRYPLLKRFLLAAQMPAAKRLRQQPDRLPLMILYNTLMAAMMRWSVKRACACQLGSANALPLPGRFYVTLPCYCWIRQHQLLILHLKQLSRELFRN